VRVCVRACVCVRARVCGVCVRARARACVCVCVCVWTDNGNVNKAPLKQYQVTHLSVNTAADNTSITVNSREVGVLHSALPPSERLENRTGTQLNERGTKWLRLEWIMNACRTAVAVS